MGGKARRGKARGHGATTLLHYMSGSRIDRRQAQVRLVDRIAERLAVQLGAKRYRDLLQSQAMAVFQTAGMFSMATAFLGEWLRTGDLGLFERYSAAVANVRRLLASLGLAGGDMGEEMDELERALRQGSRVSHDVGAGRADGEKVQA